MRTFKKILTGIGLAVGVAVAYFAPEKVEAQGATTNNYAGTGPQGPLSVSSLNSGIGGAQGYYPTSVLNLSQGTNAAGVATNQVLAGTTNTFQSTNTSFACADYNNVAFQFIGSISNSATGAFPPTDNALFDFWLSNDGSNYDSQVDPLTVQINLSLTNKAGQLIWRTNFLNTGAKSIMLGDIRLPTPGAGTNLYSTNNSAQWSGVVDRKHVNVNTQ